MEQITKQQLILVCLLVSIVTAVATSVATVSLNDGNTAGDRTIYQVIEKSIEKVADSPAVKSIVGTPTVTKTISKTSTELSPADIADQKSDSIVRIYEKLGDTKNFVALGIAVGAKNMILSSALPDTTLPEHPFLADTSDGREIPVRLEKLGLSNNFSVFSIQYAQGEKNKIPTLTLKDLNNIKLGSNVVALGGKESGNVVSTGIVTEIASADQNTTIKDTVVTDMSLSSSISGWLLFDTQGNLVAFESGFGDSKKSSFISAKILVGEIKDYL